MGFSLPGCFPFLTFIWTEGLGTGLCVRGTNPEGFFLRDHSVSWCRLMQGSFLLPILVSLPRCDLWGILAHLRTSAEPGRFMALGNSNSRAIYLSQRREVTQGIFLLLSYSYLVSALRGKPIRAGTGTELTSPISQKFENQRGKI